MCILGNNFFVEFVKGKQTKMYRAEMWGTNLAHECGVLHCILCGFASEECLTEMQLFG